MKTSRWNKIKAFGLCTLLLFGALLPHADAIIVEIVVTGSIWDNSDGHLIRKEIILPSQFQGNVSGRIAAEAFRGVGYKGLPVLSLVIPSTETYWNLNLTPDFIISYGIDYPYVMNVPKTSFTTYEDGEHEFTELKDKGVAKVNSEGVGNNDQFKDHTYDYDGAGGGASNATHARHPIALIYAEVPVYDDVRYYPTPDYHKYGENSWGDVIYDRYKDSVYTEKYGYLKANLAYGSDYQAFQAYLDLMDGEADGMRFKITTEKIHFSNNDPGDNVFESFADYMSAVFGDEEQNYILRFVRSGVVGPDDDATQIVHLKGGTIVSKLSFRQDGTLAPQHFIGQFGPSPEAASNNPDDQEVNVRFQGTFISYGPTDLPNNFGSAKLPHLPTQQVSQLGQDGIFNPSQLPDVADPVAEPISPVGVYHIRN